MKIFPKAGLTLLCATLVAACTTQPPSRDTLVTEADIVGLHRLIRKGELRCTEIVRAYLNRIDAFDKPTGLNAISMVADDALAQAAVIDAHIKSGKWPGPLTCAPLGIKDNIDVTPFPTTAGSIVLAQSRPPDDAEVVARLRAAGAIVLAKTNMAEWAFSPRRTISSTRGETANAYSLDRVPAGSSGGTASAVAASLVLAGLGTDTGNSIRGPSSHLALVGMRSTWGLASLDGIVPLLLDRDVVGPMTRTVADNARILSVMTGKDYVSALAGRPLAGVRLGVLRALANPKTMAEGPAAAFTAALDELRAAGAVIVDDIEIENFEAHAKDGYYCPRFRADVNEYLASLGGSAPERDVARIFDTGRFAPQSRAQFAFFIKEEGPVAGKDCPPLERSAGRLAFRRAVVGAMDAAGVTALVYPSWTHPPARIAHAEKEYRGDNSQVVAPATGLPAITVPMRFVDDLPAGLQLLGRPNSERALYGLAWHYEQETHHRRPPATFSGAATHRRRSPSR
ncbi:MAG: amidase [Pseudomonadota bacterium]|nr:amidase [Pseudomonadota bacterium]